MHVVPGANGQAGALVAVCAKETRDYILAYARAAGLVLHPT